MHHCVRWLTGLVLALTIAAPTSAETPLEEIRVLVDEGDMEAAYELARELRFDLEGEPVFDFYYGVAAINAGHANEGVFALERVVMQRPGFTRARLELARGYFLLEEDRRAERHFEAVLAQDPPGPVRTRVERYQQRIQQRADRYSTVVTGYLEAGAGYDDNVNRATDQDTIDFGLFTLEPDDKRGDPFLRSKAGGRISRPFTPNATIFASGDAEQRSHPDESDFNTGRIMARSGGIYHGEVYSVRLNGRIQRYWVGGERFQDQYGIEAILQHSLSARTHLTAEGQLFRLRYDEQSERDSTLGLVSLGATRIWSAGWQPVVALSVFGGREDPRESGVIPEAQTERDLYGINARLRLHPTPEWRLSGSVQLRRSTYGEDHFLFGETRLDDHMRLTLNLDWAPTPAWRLGPELTYQHNNSNIELFDYDRTMVEMRVRYDFH